MGTGGQAGKFVDAKMMVDIRHVSRWMNGGRDGWIDTEIDLWIYGLDTDMVAG
jgi:hypothetical protein